MKFLGITFVTPAEREKEQAYAQVTEESQETGQAYDRFPIPVTVVHDITTVKQEAAQQVSYATYKLVGTNPPLQILPRNPRRKRAIVTIQAQTSGPLVTYNYDPSQLQGGAGFQAILAGVPSLEIKNERALWALCLGGGASTATVSVMDESYAEEELEAY